MNDKSVKSKQRVNKDSFFLRVMAGFDLSEGYWEAMGRVCQQKSDHTTFFLVNNIETVNNYEDVVGVMLESKIEVNGGRVMVFILWLRRHSQAYSHWCRFVQDFPQVCIRALCQLVLL